MSIVLEQKRQEFDELNRRWKGGEGHLQSKVRQAYCDWFHQAVDEGLSPDRLDIYIEDEHERFMSKLRSGLDGHVYWHLSSKKSRFNKNDGTSRLPALWWWEFVHHQLGINDTVKPVCGDERCINPFHSRKVSWLSERNYWTEERCINAIKVAMMKLGIDQAPTVVQYRNLGMKPCDNTIRSKFGSWEKAIKATKLPYSRYGSITSTKEDCYAGIVLLYEILGKVPIQQDVRNNKAFLKEAGLPESHSTYRKHLGSNEEWDKHAREAIRGSERQVRQQS